MTFLRVKNWADFQHYKDRGPPWIKLHKKLLDDFKFHKLPLASRALAPMLWLVASESKDGTIAFDIEQLAFRLHCDESELESAIKPLIENGFLLLDVECASTVLAACTTETETETETETQDSEAIASDAGASLEPKVEIFGQGLAWLQFRTKRSEGSLRSWLGKCCGEFGDHATLAALLEIQSAQPPPVDPISRMKSILEPRKRQNGHALGPATGIAAGFAAALAEREADRGADYQAAQPLLVNRGGSGSAQGPSG